MRESRTYGFVRAAHSDMRPYRDPDISLLCLKHRSALFRLGYVSSVPGRSRPRSVSGRSVRSATSLIAQPAFNLSVLLPPYSPCAPRPGG